jgi:hypothetical protein
MILLYQTPDHGRERFPALVGQLPQERVVVFRDPEMQLPVAIYHVPS